MSSIDTVLSAAKALNESGKAPSVALLKSKLGNSIPMPLIIQGLQRFKAMSSNELADVAEFSAPTPIASAISVEQQIQSLTEQLKQLQDAYTELQHRVTQLEQDGKR